MLHSLQRSSLNRSLSLSEFLARALVLFHWAAGFGIGKPPPKLPDQCFRNLQPCGAVATGFFVVAHPIRAQRLECGGFSPAFGQPAMHQPPANPSPPRRLKNSGGKRAAHQTLRAARPATILVAIFVRSRKLSAKPPICRAARLPSAVSIHSRSSLGQRALFTGEKAFTFLVRNRSISGALVQA